MNRCICAFWLILAASVVLKSPAKRIPSFAGRYRALIASIVNKSDDYPNVAGKFWIRLRSTTARGKQPQYGWGYTYMSEPFTDDIKVEVTMALRANNQWKKNAFVMKFDRGCSAGVLHAPSLMQMLYGPEHNLTCPIKPVGLREIKNQTFELTFPNFPVLPFGRYLFTLAMLSKTHDPLGVGAADCNLVPRL